MENSTSTSATVSAPASDASQRYQLTVNSYDRTATLIIALLVIVGFAVLGLLVVYFAKKTFPIIEAIPVVPVEATSQNPAGLARDPEPPGVEEAPELSDPQLQTVLDTLTSAVSPQEVLLSDQILNAEDQAGKGKGQGDSRMAGPGGEGVLERVPRWERWKIRFVPESTSDFASWLDYHKIEVGVLGYDNSVHYATHLSSGSPHVKKGPPEKEIRGYTSAADGPMPTLTIALARKADIARLGPTVLLFYPHEVESLLHFLEGKTRDKKFSGKRDVNSIRQTVFTVVHEGGKYAFEVLEQKYF